MRHPLPSVLAILFATLVSAGAALAQVVNISSSVTVNTTWGPTGSPAGTLYRITTPIAVNAGVTLTIQPGTIVKFNAGTYLTVNGTLIANGTAVDNIFFTSIRDDNVGGDTNGDGNATTPAVGDWYYLTFPDASPNASQLTYCDIRFGGAGQSGVLTFVSSNQSVSNCVIRRSYYGIDCQGSAAPAITNTSIEASQQTPIVLDFTASPVFSSLVFSSSNNGYDAIGLRGGTLAAGTVATLPKRGATVGANPITNVTYVLFGALTINSGASLTVDPGVVIKPTSSHVITVAGQLVMNGTAAAGDTITITSISDDNFGQPGDTNNNGSITAPNRGDWGRIVYAAGATGSIQRCRLKFGSNNGAQGMVEMSNNSIAVSNTLLSDAGHGLAMFGVSNPAVTDVAIQNCSSTPVLMSVSANPTYTSISLLANAVTAIGIHGEDVSVDSSLPQRTLGGFANITYYLMNGLLTMRNPAVLTVSPGVVIKNELSGGGIVVEGALVADGTPAQPIVFTSVRDDLYGNPADTNGDGATTVPATGNWNYIRFTATSNDALCVLDNCRVTYGTYSPFDNYPANVWVTSAAPTLTACFISKGYYGIRVDGNSTPVIAGCDINNCTQAPIVMSALSDPAIATDNVFSTNGFNALALISETLSQNARIRYRPGVGTPTFAYLPTGPITVASGVTLAIDPRVVLKPSGSYTVFAVNGALNVVGSNATSERVVFTSRRDDNPLYGGDTTPNDSSTPQAGDWGDIVFSDTSVDGACVIRNVLFQFGGSGGNELGTLITQSASPRFAGVEFFQNATAMTFVGQSRPVIDSTTILNCTQLPIVASLISDPVFPAPARIVLANNAYTCLGILGETVAQNVRTRVRALGGSSNIAYAPAGTITIAFGARWTIDPGIVLKMGRFSIDPIGTTILIDGALVADGKPDSLIVFTSSADDAFGGDIRNDGALTTPAAGNWNYLQFNAISNDTATVIDHCRFRYGGYSGQGSLRFISAGPVVTNSFVTLVNGPGVVIDGNSTPRFTDVQIDSCTHVPVSMSLVSEPVFQNVQFLGNGYTALGVLTESIAQDLRWPVRAVSGRANMPWLLQGQLTIGLGATLTIQPGVIVKSTTGGSIVVQRAIQALGRSVEPESLIVFTSYRDDFYGGDTNMDGAATAPAASDWNHVTIEGTAIDPQVVFRNCVFRYGGSGGTTGALRAVSSSPSVDSCQFAYNTVGISVEGASNPVVHGSSLWGNTQYAINNTGNSFCVNAEGNWWGAVSGPNDNSATADLCGLGLNAGTGDRVSNNVDYLPFATAGLQNALLGDVSLNGQVLAYDASLVLQSLVAIITLSPLQEQVADVSGASGVSAFDASLILQYVAGIIPAFPAVANGAGRPVEEAALREAVARARGTFEVTLGEPVAVASGWEVPVRVRGDAPAWALRLELAGSDAGRLTAADGLAGAALHALHVADGVARVAVAAAEPLPAGEVLRLRFETGGDPLDPPALRAAIVNESAAAPRRVPTGPAVSFLAAPAPNPAATPVRWTLAMSAADAGGPALLRVVDVAGRTVRTLVDGALPAGVHEATWDLRDGLGRAVPAGLYFVEARAGRWHATRRLAVVR
jgi:hypothetical protein